jgi:hypothetical protein
LLLVLNVLVIFCTSQAVAHELKIIKDCISGTVARATSVHDADNHQTALPNLFLRSSIDSHPVINSLNRVIGPFHVKKCDPNIGNTVSQIFVFNHIFLLV